MEKPISKSEKVIKPILAVQRKGKTFHNRVNFYYHNINIEEREKCWENAVKSERKVEEIIIEDEKI